MKYFLDTSALVKLFHEESGTHIVESMEFKNIMKNVYICSAQNKEDA